MTEAEKKEEARIMTNLARFYCEKNVRVLELNPAEGIGCSLNEKKDATIWIAYDYPFPGLSPDEAKIVRFGVFVHEMLHILYTDFAKEKEILATKKPSEQKIRHDINNIIEDPAIEFFGRNELWVDFLKMSLKKAIGYFYKNGRNIEEGKTPLEQVISAMIHYGDIGLLKGEFTFPEAREAFVKLAPVMSQAIEEKDCESRLKAGEKIFDVIKPLWQEQMDSLFGGKELDDLLKDAGKTSSSGSEKPMKEPEDESFDENASKQREKTLEELSQKDKANADEETVSDGSPAKEGQCSREDLPSGDGEKNLEGTNLEDGSCNGRDNLPPEYQISEKDLEALKEMEASFHKMLKREERTDRRQKEEEDTKVEVKSPYFGEVTYKVTGIECADKYEYQDLKNSLEKDIRNFRSRLKRIFCDPSFSKEYRVNGKVNLPRYGGCKLTSRVFTKTRKPDKKENLAVMILADLSGSMGSNQKNLQRISIMLAESFKDFDVAVKIIGFNTVDSHYSATYYDYGRGWKNSQGMRENLSKMDVCGGTFLGHAIRYAGGLLKKRPEQHKLFLCITDADPTSRHYRDRSDGLNDCRYAVKEIRKYSDVIGVGIGAKNKKSFQFIFSKDFVEGDQMDTLINELPKRIGRILKK